MLPFGGPSLGWDDYLAREVEDAVGEDEDDEG